jgi:Mrp family chromosome partitioning ATPase
VTAEGNSTTTANFTIALADVGLSVLVIDADLRWPKLADYMGLKGAIRLSDVLIYRISLPDAFQSH